MFIIIYANIQYIIFLNDKWEYMYYLFRYVSKRYLFQILISIILFKNVELQN